MEKLAKRLAGRIASSIECDSEREAVIAYGLIAILQITVTVSLVLLLGVLVGSPAEAMIVCLSASILRQYSGGAHAATAELCTCISAVYCTAAALLAKKVLTPAYGPIPMTASVAVIFILAFWIVYKLAPVDSPGKPIRKQEKKKRLKKASLTILTVYLLLSVLLLVFGNRSGVLVSCLISLLFGVSWQVFTLTFPGSVLLGSINQFVMRKEVHK
jgi:accessory gene regulator B